MKYQFKILCLSILFSTVVQADRNHAVLDVFVTQEGAHIVGGPGCPEGYRSLGSVADCGGGNCYGNQLICGRAKPAQYLNQHDRVAVDLWLTPEGTHVVGGTGCPYGFHARGSIADCGGGRCYGNQLLCVRSVRPQHLHLGDWIIKHGWLTPEGTHVAGGTGCPPGLEFKGSFADCGHGTCYGNQLLCIGYGNLRE